MSPRLFRAVLLLFLLLTHLRLSYNFNQAWWHSAAGTVALIIIGCAIWGKRFRAVGGLDIPAKTFPFIAASAILFTVLSAGIILWVGNHRVTVGHSGLKNYVHNFFYILNEEMIVGAMLLYFLNRRLSMRPVFASALLALAVAILHLVLYKWYFRDRGLLMATTVASLFLVVFAKNNLIIRYGHIGYAWALHFGWMVIMYGCLHFYRATGNHLTDLEKFNLYLGTPAIVCLGAVLAAITLVIPDRDQGMRQAESR